ncbi:MAG: phage tail protein I [Pseudomonadota bacterium]
MGSVEAVLAPKSGPFVQALAAAMSDDLPVPIRQVLDPAEAPSAFLPWLAVHDGVRLWFSDWSEARKRTVITNGPTDAGMVGTRPGSVRYLSYVDGILLDAVVYPSRFVQGRAVLGRTPIGHPPFLARYLVKVETVTPPRALVLGRGVLGRARLKRPTREPFNRALAALRTAKAPETEYRVDFGHLRPLSIADAPPLDGTFALDAYVSRNWL